jgi:myosin protein heavy chain
MQNPPPPPPRDAGDDHDNHDIDEALVRNDGMLLKALDQLVDILIGLSAEGTNGAAAVQLVLGQWYQKLHPALYERLVQLKRLEGTTGAPTSAEHDDEALRLEVANLQRKLGNTELLLGVAQRKLDQLNKDKEEHDDEALRLEVANLQRKLGNTELLLGVAQRKLDQLNKDKEEHEAVTRDTSTRLKMAEGAKRGLDKHVKELDEVIRGHVALELKLRERLAFVEDLWKAAKESGGGGTEGATAAKSSSAQVSQLKRDLEKTRHLLELAEARIEESKQEENRWHDMATMTKGELEGAKRRISKMEAASRRPGGAGVFHAEGGEGRVLTLKEGASSSSPRVKELEAAVAKLDAERSESQSMMASMEEEIRELEAAKASLEGELDEARRVAARVAEVEEEKEGISAELEEAKEALDYAAEDMQEAAAQRESESEANASELREEIERLQRRLEDEEQKEQEGADEILAEENARLREQTRALEQELARQRLSHRGGSEGSEGSAGSTRANIDRTLTLQERVLKLEQAASTMHKTNERLLRERQDEQERLSDLEAENRALRFARPNVPDNLVGILEENKRYREQLAELQQAVRRGSNSGSSSPPAAVSRSSPQHGDRLSEEERAELEELRERNHELQLEIVRNKKTKMTDEELQRQLQAAEDALRVAQEAIIAKMATIETAETSRRAALNMSNRPADMTLEEKHAYNDAAAARNIAAGRAIEEMRIALAEMEGRVPSLKGKVTRLRKQAEIRKQEYALEEESGKRPKRTEARVAMTMVV